MNSVRLIFAVVLLCCVSLARAYPDEFLQRWRDSGEFGKEIDCVVRVASNIDKVGLDDVTSGRIIGKNPEPIRISAARHEHEGLQIVLSPVSGVMKHVSIEASDLIGPGGKIDHSNITINPVGYVRIYAGKPTERLVPDPLLLGDVPQLEAGQNQPIWISIYVPPATKPGNYSGSISINELRIPLELHVRNFDIPKKISLRSSFWLFRDQINRFYHLKEVSIDDYLKWVDFALRYRVNPIDVYEGHCGQLLDIIQSPDPANPLIGGVNPHPDFTNWDKYIDHMVAGGANTIHLGMSHHFGAFFGSKEQAGSPQQLEQVKNAIRILEDHYKS
jgi:hypothetical protein